MAKQNTPAKTSLSSVKVNMKAGLWEMPVTESMMGWLSYGKGNKGFEDLTFLYNNEPHHQGIVDGKAKYISGTKIIASTPQGTEWLKRWNPAQSAYEVTTDINRNWTFCGTRAYKIIPNLLGLPLWIFHLDFSRCRISKCETKVLYCDDWNRSSYYGIDEFPIWYKGCKEPSVMLQKRFKQTTKKLEAAYAGLEYESGLKTIHTLCAIGNSRHSLVKNDMGGGSILTIYAPKPESKSEQEEIVSKVKGNYAGDENTGEVAVVWVEGDAGKGAEWSTVPMNGLDKRYSEMNGQAIRDVYSAHQVPPELFKYIKEGSSLFENKDVIINQHELFMNEYVIPEQVSYLKGIKTLFEARYPGQTCEFSIEQFSPIGQNIPLDNEAVISKLDGIDPNIVINYLDKKFKLNLPKAVQPNGLPSNNIAPVAAAQVNDHLKNLTGKQMQGIDRIVRKYKAGTYSQAQAILLLKNGFGLTDQDCMDFLGQQDPQQPVPIAQRIAMAKQFDFFAKLDSMAHDSVDDEVLEVSYVGMTKFAETSVSDQQKNDVLNKVKADPEATNEEISKALGLSIDVVTTALTWLLAKKLLSKVDGVFKPNKEKKAVIYTEYNYALSPEAKPPVIIATTRDWCKTMYKKYGVGKKSLSFEAIDSMTDDLELNAWDYRGGFWGDNPYCRHVWQGTTKVRYE